MKLLKEKQCECLIHSSKGPLAAIVEEVTAAMDVQTLGFLPRSQYDRLGKYVEPFESEIGVEEAKRRPAVIMHSAGSTGLPKALDLPHGRLCVLYALGEGERDLLTLPLSVCFYSFQCPMLTRFIAPTLML